MNDLQFLKLAISLHTRTIVGLCDAISRADSPAEKKARLDLIRDAAIEFKTEMSVALATVKVAA